MLTTSVSQVKSFVSLKNSSIHEAIVVSQCFQEVFGWKGGPESRAIRDWVKACENDDTCSLHFALYKKLLANQISLTSSRQCSSFQSSRFAEERNWEIFKSASVKRNNNYNNKTSFVNQGLRLEMSPLRTQLEDFRLLPVNMQHWEVKRIVCIVLNCWLCNRIFEPGHVIRQLWLLYFGSWETSFIIS